MVYMQKVREQSPLVHSIMNEVASEFAANGLIAIGASPSIASNPKEAEEMARNADAVVLNLGTLNDERREAMLLAGKAANQAGVPVLLDPIAIGATTYRTGVIEEILSSVKLAAICANAGEVAVLGGGLTKTDSPDSALSENDPAMAQKVARKYDTVVLATGKHDVITAGDEATICHNGHAMLQNITASGCLLTAVTAAFISAAGEDVYRASVEAVAGYGLAAERAMTQAYGPGSFRTAFLDQLYRLDDAAIDAEGRLDAAARFL